MSIYKKILIGVGGLLVLMLAVQVVNAAKYRMVVNVVEGENIMGVNPTDEKLDFGDLSRNNRMRRQVVLQNGGGLSTYVLVLKAGPISHLVNVEPSFFVLEPGAEQKINFEIFIPPSAETKKYSGWTWVFRVPKPI